MVCGTGEPSQPDRGRAEYEMKIRRTDCEDTTTTEELLAAAITEDVAEVVRDWFGQSDPLSLGLKGDIHHAILDRFKNGVEI